MVCDRNLFCILKKKQPNGIKRYIVYYHEERGNGRQTAKTDKIQKLIKARLLIASLYISEI